MKRLGFIHDMMDVKVLILFVMARVGYPVGTQEMVGLIKSSVLIKEVTTI